VLYYGKDEPLPERIPLRAGPLTLIYEDSDLRSIQWSGREVLRRVYVAIRDRNWGTVAPVISNVEMDVHTDHFSIVFDVANREGEIDFAWRGTITGSADGVLTYDMDGIARCTFMRNRIGFCILHPAEYAGTRCRIEHVVGEHSLPAQEQATLPVLIQPYQPLKPFEELAALAHEVESGVWAHLRFEGDIFEMEDQRNWTDASFKTFCTPLRLPYPVEIAEGTRIRQQVRLQVVDERVTAGASAVASTAPRLMFTVADGHEGQKLPKLGLGVASHGEPLSAQAVERLRALKLDHLRVDVRLADADCCEQLQAGAAEAAALDVPLHAALYINAENAAAQLLRLLPWLQEVRPRVTRWLIYPTPEKFLGGSPTAEVLAAAHGCLDGVVPGATFAAGTDTDFIFVQRSVPPLEQIDMLTFSINPQVHAFDNASLAETLATQSTAVQTARELAQGKPVMVSPITLKMRYNAYATAPPSPTLAGQLPPNVDVRQMSLFGAGWTLGSIAAVTAAGAESVTYYETTGWRGVMERDQGSPVPDKFQSHAGGLFPLYYVFAVIAPMLDAQVLPSRSTDPLRVTGMALEKGGARRVLLANLTPEIQQVHVSGLAGSLRVRRLDETNAEAAMLDPGAMDLAVRQVQVQTGGCLTLDLLPYAFACVDSSV
jgi:hypothetical protein